MIVPLILALLCAMLAALPVVQAVADRRKLRWERALARAEAARLPAPEVLPAWEDGWRAGFQRALTMVDQGWNRDDLRRWIEEERS